MIVKKNKEKVKENFVKGKVDEIEILTPNIADKVMTYADEKLVLDEIINKCTKFTTHEDGLPLALFMYSLLSAKLKRLFSISSATVALTAESLVEKFKVNIKSEKGFTDESNIRKFIKKMCKGEEVKEEEIEAKIKEIEEKNKKQKNEKKKKVIDREKIKLELQIKKDGHNVVTFFNDVMKQLRKKIERPKIHILDCVKIPVNYNNPNYELATTINDEGKRIQNGCVA